VTAIEFRVLGPLEVWRDGQQLAVRGGKPRALLAMLLLHAGEAVSTDRLIDALWGERPPPTAANALQAHVSALRRAFEPDRRNTGADGVLITRTPGYLLRIAGDEFDVARFERLLTEGRDVLPGDPAAAAGLLREALGLWRGPALADFVFEPFALAEAARLEELRLGAVEDRLEADLALGRHAEVVAELEGLLAEHPLRERLAGQLMLALYRCGRQADASRVFHATRSRLVEELAMEPEPSLRRLLQRILEQDLTLDWSAPNGATARRGNGERTAHNLPAELTSFIGRERELEEVCSLLREGRLVTLTGAGGSGKTRLALRVARQEVGLFSDGVWLVELAPLADPALVETSLAAALGVRQQSGPLIEALKRRLDASQLLVVLDNCEHLVGACAELTRDLLSSCGQLRILATSREPLKVAGEVTWLVPGLELPDASTLASPELNRYAAIRLFVERAAAARPAFALESEGAEAVALLCRRLDGIPLAIELAAARTRALSAEEILRRLDDRFRLLTGGARGALQRQQTLRATVDWSHELLDEAERVLFRRLSVFAGGWTLADAEAVCADQQLPVDAVCDVLCELVAKSLVVTDSAVTGATRYRMLETLRDYASERLTAADERHPAARRHFSHFLELAEQVYEQQQTRGSAAGLELLVAQQDNIRAGLAFAQDADSAGLLRLATAAEQLWLAGRITEGRRWLEEALADAPEPTRERVRALNAAAVLTVLQSAHDQTRRLLNESLAVASSLGDRPGEARARLWLGFLELTGDPPGTRQSEQSLAIHEALADRLGVCRSLVFMGIAMSQLPDSQEQGYDALQRAVQMARGLEERWGEAFARIFLGLAELEAGNRELAAGHLRSALVTDALGPIRGTALDGFAELAVLQDPRRAIRLLAASAALRERDGGRPPAWLRRKAAATRARAEQRLDPLDAQQAWDDGSAMTAEETLAYALEEHEPRHDLQRRHSERAR
jgi:predicted ATPase/DNA-binding SARP family transcriptional activator